MKQCKFKWFQVPHFIPFLKRKYTLMPRYIVFCEHITLRCIVPGTKGNDSMCSEWCSVHVQQTNYLTNITPAIQPRASIYQTVFSCSHSCTRPNLASTSTHQKVNKSWEFQPPPTHNSQLLSLSSLWAHEDHSSVPGRWVVGPGRQNDGPVLE